MNSFRVSNFIDLSYVLNMFGEAASSLQQNRFRSVLSILGITVGITAVMVVGSISNTGHFVIFKELETFGLKSIWIMRDFEEEDPQRSIREGTGIETADLVIIRSGCCSSIKRITPVVKKNSTTPVLIRNRSRYSNAHVEGVGFEYLHINSDTIIHGRPFQEEDERRRRMVAILGSETSLDLFGIQDAIGKEIYIDQNKYIVIGILKAKSRDFLASIGSAGGQDANNRILIPFTTFQQQLGSKGINYLQAETTGLENTDIAVSQIIRILQRRHNYRFSYRAETMVQYIRTAKNILQLVSFIGALAASVSLLVGGLAIMNIMSTSVLERTREIGIRKALGASRRDIRFQFLLEAVLLSSIGGLFGLCIGGLVSYGLAIFMKSPWMPSWIMLATALIVSIIVGLLSGYYPARRAAAMRPVEALRYE